MNIFKLIDRGAAHANVLQDRAKAKQAEATEEARRLWLNALFVDECRAWDVIGQSSKEVLSGMTTMLVLAGMCHVCDQRESDNVEIRVIRGAISAAEQAGKVGGVISAADARAFSAACNHAREIIQRASHEAIESAAVELRKLVGLDA